MNTHRTRFLAQDYTIVYQSPDPEHIFSYSPGIFRCSNGRLVATLDVGGTGVKDLAGEKVILENEGGTCWQGKIFTSDDGGRSWHFRTNFPAIHARVFESGNMLYLLGQAGDLVIMKSSDNGCTWKKPAFITEGQYWHQAPCAIHYANNCIYAVMERRISHDIKGWYVGEIAPVLLRGELGTDLTKKENWTFASELSFRDTIGNLETDPDIDYFGIPFYSCPYPSGSQADGVENRICYPIGWLETNVIQIKDPAHYWYDPKQQTFHLWMRAHTGRTNFACIAKVQEHGKRPGTGEMETMLETVPSGKRILYIPCPGGQNKFHVLYDDVTRLYWLLSIQTTDSMTRADRLPSTRHNIPSNERRRLQLHFSKNMVDWCFAGLVCSGEKDVESRSYASMVIDGDELHVLCRSGNQNAKNPHDVNLITFHTINNFRELAY